MTSKENWPYAKETVLIEIMRTGRMQLRNVSFQISTSGSGEQFLLQFCKAEGRVKGMFFHRHRYDHLYAAPNTLAGGAYKQTIT